MKSTRLNEERSARSERYSRLCRAEKWVLDKGDGRDKREAQGARRSSITPFPMPQLYQSIPVTYKYFFHPVWREKPLMDL